MRKRLLDALILFGAMLYILLGVSITPLHGDELTQIYMAHDSYTMLQGAWDQLPYTALAPMTDLKYLSLINGTVNKTLIGFVWMVQGRSEWQLPGLYDWTHPISVNRVFGNVPTDEDIVLSRWPSAIFTALSLIPLFFLMRQLRCSRLIGYFAVALFALNPAILLNGRRAVMEGSLMFGSLITIYWLVLVVKADEVLTRIPVWLRYVILGALAGFTVAAKFSGIFVAAAVVLTIIVLGLRHNDARRLAVYLGITVSAMLGIWAILNPAYWSDPVGAVGVMLRERDYLLANQTKSSPLHYTNLWQRISVAIEEPYLAPPQYYELDSWSYMIGEQIYTYQQSPLAGINFGPGGDILLMALAGLGLGVLAYQGRRMQPVSWAMLSWIGLMLIETLTIPLGWQRYYLPLMPVVIVLTSIGAERLLWAIRLSLSRRVIIARYEYPIPDTFDSPTA